MRPPTSLALPLLTLLLLLPHPTTAFLRALLKPIEIPKIAVGVVGLVYPSDPDTSDYQSLLPSALRPSVRSASCLSQLTSFYSLRPTPTHTALASWLSANIPSDNATPLVTDAAGLTAYCNVDDDDEVTTSTITTGTVTVTTTVLITPPPAELAGVYGEYMSEVNSWAGREKARARVLGAGCGAMLGALFEVAVATDREGCLSGAARATRTVDAASLLAMMGIGSGTATGVARATGTVESAGARIGGRLAGVGGGLVLMVVMVVVGLL